MSRFLVSSVNGLLVYGKLITPSTINGFNLGMNSNLNRNSMIRHMKEI